MKSYTIPETHTAGQLVTLHRMCRAEMLTLRVRGFAGRTFTSPEWLGWFRAKLDEKINSRDPRHPTGRKAGEDYQTELRRLGYKLRGRIVIRRGDAAPLGRRVLEALAERIHTDCP